MPTINDIYRFTTTIQYEGATCRVVDFRRIDTLPANPMTDPELAQSYGNLFVAEVMPKLSNQAEMTNVLAENLTDGISFADWGFSAMGGKTGDPMPSYVACSIKLKRSTKITRNGYKRLPAVPELLSDGNAYLASSTEKEDLEFFFWGITLFEDITDPLDTFQMRGVIVGRTLNVSGVYELDLSKINPVASAQVQPNLTTQNTRKIIV